MITIMATGGDTERSGRSRRTLHVTILFPLRIVIRTPPIDNHHELHGPHQIYDQKWNNHHGSLRWRLASRPDRCALWETQIHCTLGWTKEHRREFWLCAWDHGWNFILFLHGWDGDRRVENIVGIRGHFSGGGGDGVEGMG